MFVRLRLLIAMALGGFLCLPLGCGEKKPAPVTANYRRADSVENPLQPQAVAELQLEASVDALLAEHPKWVAADFIAAGDAKKQAGSFQQAASHYLAAIRLQPKDLYAQYQLACAFSLAGYPKIAYDTLQSAIQAGFWGYAMMRDDSDLERIRHAPGFAELLQRVKQLYDVEAPKRPGNVYIRVPKGSPPAQGWPILLLLHGYGDHGESYVPLAEEAAQNGFVGIAISGPVVNWEQKYSWPEDQFSETHDYLRTVLDRYHDRKDMDRSRVFLLGFSQGAKHAVGLVASYSDIYAGAIALSPGPTPPFPHEIRPSPAPRPLYLIVGENEHPANKLAARQAAALWKQLHWPLKQESHPGSHEIPPGWSDHFPGVLAWLLDPLKDH